MKKTFILSVNLIILFNLKSVLSNTIHIKKDITNDYILKETKSVNKHHNLPNSKYPHQHHTSFKHDHDELLVHTGSGRMRGTSFYMDEHLKDVDIASAADTSKKLTRVNAWLGIPFAEKPIGDLRFKRPVPVKNWQETLNATKLPNSCYQVDDMVIPNFEGVQIWNSNTEVSEDCLYLNIWAPHPMPKNSPVIVRFMK